MIGVIKKPNWKKQPFDPTTHIATESNFIELLENGVYDSNYIGYKVQLSNTVDYNNGLWVIADVNHDSSNVGQINYYDLISQDCFYNTTFGNDMYWRNSTPRTWLNNTFYPGFSSDFKSRMLDIKYNSNGTWYNDDKIIIPSCTELNYTDESTLTEGVAYPIFTDGNSRIKNAYGGSSAAWQVRTCRTDISATRVIFASGDVYSNRYPDLLYYRQAPILRVH